MAEFIVNLMKVLENEVGIYTDLLHIVEKTQQALTKNNLEELNKMLDSQQLLIVKAAKLEEIRRQQQEQVAKFLAMPLEELTLSKIIEKAPEAYRQGLADLQQTLLDLVDKINSTNRHNEELIKDSLKYIDYTMELITGATDNAKTYDNKPGTEKKNQQKSRIFDKRV